MNIVKATSVLLLSLPVAGVLLLTACTGSGSEFDATGTFEATEVLVSAEVSGRILTLDVHEGQQIPRGAVVGLLDSAQWYLQKQQLQSSMRAALVRRPEIDTQLAALEQQLQTQIQERHRVERLLEARAANQKQLDDIQAQIALIERQIKAQHSSLSNTSEGISGDVAAMHFQMAQLDDYLRKCHLTNPMSGTVLVKYAEPGEMAVPGRPLYKLGDTGNMILRAYLTSAQVAQIKTGQKVEVYADYGEDGYRTFEGVVQWVSDKAEFTPKTIQTRDERANLVYAVKIGVQNDGYLKIGMYGEVKLNQL